MGSTHIIKWLNRFTVPISCIYLICMTAVHAKDYSEVDGVPVITEHPHDVIVPRGEPATLNCVATGPDLQITWYKDGEPVITTKDQIISHRLLLSTGALFLLRVNSGKNGKDADSGTYYCIAKNKYGEARSRDALLRIAVLRDDFRTRPRTVQAVIGGRAVLECSPPRGFPEPVVTWRKDDAELRVQDDSRIKLHPSGNLIIDRVQRSDGGFYTCVATNMVGERTSSPARLTVYEKPYFIHEPRDVKADVGSSVLFDCRVSGDPKPSIAWKKRNEQMPVGRAYIADDDRGLRIDRIQPSDEGEYVCHAKNPAGSIESSARLQVQAPPSFTKTPFDVMVESGATATFDCEADGQPEPAKFWSREGQQDLLFPGHISLDGRLKVTLDGQLIISDIRPTDEGNYVCAAMNAAGSSLSKAALRVKTKLLSLPPPIIEHGPSNQTVVRGASTTLPCQASGRTPPKVVWLKDGLVVDFDNESFEGRFVQLSTGSLQISNLKLLDSGVYTCQAKNENGESTWTASLVVEENVNPFSFPRPFDASALPATPGKPVIRNVTETSADLEWTPPEVPGASPVSGYILQYFSPEMGGTWYNVPDYVSGPSFHVKGLKPSHSYVFIVRAENSNGIGPPSQASTMFHTKALLYDLSNTGISADVDLDNAIKQLTSESLLKLEEVKTINSTAVRLKWKRRRSEAPVQGYYIKWRGPPAISNQTWVNVSGGNTDSYVLTDLHPFTNYEFFVVPYYRSVQGMPSNSLDVTTEEAPPSAPPIDVRVRMMNLTTLRISWRPPPANGINGILKGFQIIILGNGAKYNRNITTNERAASVTLFHLVPGMTYGIKVAAKSNAGIGVFHGLDPVTMNEETLREHIRLLNGMSGTDQLFHVIRRPWFIAVAGVFIWMVLVAVLAFLWWRWRKCHGKAADMPFIKINDGSIHLTAREALWMDHNNFNTTQRSLLLNNSINGTVRNGPAVYTHVPPPPSNQADFYRDQQMAAHAQYPTMNARNFDRNQSPHHYHYAALSSSGLHSNISTFYGAPQVMDDPSPYATTTLVMNSHHNKWTKEPSPPNAPILPINPIPSAPPKRFKGVTSPNIISSRQSVRSPQFFAGESIKQNRLHKPDSPPNTDISYVQSSDGTGGSTTGCIKFGTLSGGRKSPSRQVFVDFLPPPPPGHPPDEAESSMQYTMETATETCGNQGAGEDSDYNVVSETLLNDSCAKSVRSRKISNIGANGHCRTGYCGGGTSTLSDHSDDDSQRSSLMMEEGGRIPLSSSSETGDDNSEDDRNMSCVSTQRTAVQSPECGTHRPSQPCMGVSASTLSQCSYDALSAKRSSTRLKSIPQNNKKDIV